MDDHSSRSHDLAQQGVKRDDDRRSARPRSGGGGRRVAVKPGRDHEEPKRRFKPVMPPHSSGRYRVRPSDLERDESDLESLLGVRGARLHPRDRLNPTLCDIAGRKKQHRVLRFHVRATPVSQSARARSATSCVKCSS